MRDIKFRAWIPSSKEMIEIGVLELDRMVGHDYYNFYDRYAGTTAYFDPQLDEGKKSFLMQYTGLKDKHGKEIYEGDVIKSKFVGGKPMLVIYDPGKAAFSLAQDEYYLGFVSNRSDEIVVIGNIYENPELCQ